MTHENEPDPDARSFFGSDNFNALSEDDQRWMRDAFTRFKEVTKDMAKDAEQTDEEFQAAMFDGIQEQMSDSMDTMPESIKVMMLRLSSVSAHSKGCPDHGEDCNAEKLAERSQYVLDQSAHASMLAFAGARATCTAHIEWIENRDGMPMGAGIITHMLCDDLLGSRFLEQVVFNETVQRLSRDNHKDLSVVTMEEFIVAVGQVMPNAIKRVSELAQDAISKSMKARYAQMRASVKGV